MGYRLGISWVQLGYNWGIDGQPLSPLRSPSVVLLVLLPQQTGSKINELRSVGRSIWPLSSRSLGGIISHSWTGGPSIFRFVIDFEIGFNFDDFGGPGGSRGPKLPSKVWGAKRPTSWTVNLARRGTPKIFGIKADFEIYNKPNT